MSELDDYLAAAAEARQAKHKTMIVDYFPPLTEFPNERIYLGVNSWTLPDRAERWIKPGAVIIYNGIQTAGELARDYLDFKFPNKLRATRWQKTALNFHRSAPLYCSPSILEDASYVDLRAAFWNIMLLVGWNVDYNPGKWIVRGRPIDDFPFDEHKATRNALVSCGLPTPLRMWTGRKITKQYRKNSHINMGIWAFIMDTLHAIASHARQLEAVYVHTDGYILPTRNADTLLEIIDGFGLHAGIKARGVGSVIGMGNWKVGDKATKHYGHVSMLAGEVDYTYAVQREYIAAKLKKCQTNYNIRISRQLGAVMREL